jgi:hypothetical protein
MPVSITIAPADDGWAIKSAPIHLDLTFASGRRAEAHGREVAQRMAEAGQAVELEIILRDGSVAATIPFAAAA